MFRKSNSLFNSRNKGKIQPLFLCLHFRPSLLKIVKKNSWNIFDKSNSEVIKNIKRPLNISTNKLSQISFPNSEEFRVNKLKDYLRNHIQLNGPIGIDEYMKICLYNKNFGYYTTKDHIFGEKGDFITSPEISQMFGEMIALFIFKIYQDSFKNAKTWDLLEIGAGRGLLMADILNCLGDFNSLKGLNVVIVETSDKLSKIQQENINSILLKKKIFTEYEYDKEFKIDTFEDKNNRFKMKWFDSLDKYISYRNGIILEDANQNPLRNWVKFTQIKVNDSLNPLIVINNELFDALPIKKFAYHQSSWREVLIDIQKEVKKDKLNFFKKSIKDISKNNIFTNSQSILDPSINNENQENNLSFEYTYSPPDSINVRKILQPQITFGDDNINPQEGDTYEFSTEQVRYMYSICYLLATTKNAHALICDYGEETAFSNSFRGIKSQKLYKNDEILKYTGECDLSSYVNFKVLKKVINSYQNNLKLGGIIKQGDFLEILQIYERLKVLQKETINFKIKDILLKQYDRLTRHDQMGDIYKFMYIHKFSNKPIYPFTEYGLNLIADSSKY